MIPLMELTRQYESLREELDEAALRVLHSGKYILGDEVEQFEREFAAYCGTKYAVGVGNGTDALVLALLAAGIEQGDEVITCAMSFFATAEAISIVGAIPVFIDCSNDTHLIDVTQIESKITEKTRAILPVHLYGQCADMNEINKIAKKYGLYVIEDCAQAAGAEYAGRKAGSLGDMGCFSFFPTKNLGCAGDGGAIVTDDEELYKLCQAYRVHGSGLNGLMAYNKRQSEKNDLCDVDFENNLPKYFNFVIGRNSRLDAIQAALLRVKLPHLEEWNAARGEIAGKYQAGIVNNKIKKPICSNSSTHIYYVYIVEVEKRKEFRAYMEERGITTGVYFPLPLHLQKVFEKLGYQRGDMPNAEYLAEHNVAIPIFAELSVSEQKNIIKTINTYSRNI